MKNVLICFSFLVLFSYSAFSQDYKTHKVKQGESIESIAKLYQVTPFDIYALNPDAKTAFQPDVVLIIPKSRILETPVEIEEKKLLNYKSHKVKRKETIFSVSQKYGLTVEDIKVHNKRLYSEVLRKGDRVRIPKFGIITTTTNLGNTFKTYQVQKSEGKWRIAYKFGISVPELEKLNPTMSDTLRFGEELIVPYVADNEELLVDDNFGYYTVLPKEGFLAIYRKTGLLKEDLETLNEGLSESGLQVGMVLKVPKDALINIETREKYDTTSLISHIENYNTKKLAIMLPFQLHRLDMDSIQEVRSMLRKESALSNISLDFHSGVLVALDSAKNIGISTKLDVYDTQARVIKVTRDIQENDFSNYDAVIGPFMSNSFERASSLLKTTNTPIVSPVTKADSLYYNVFQTVPEQSLLTNTILNFVEKDSLVENVIVIADSKHRATSDIIKSRFPLAKQIFTRFTKKNKRDKEKQDAYFILRKDLEEQFKPGLNIVFLETSDNGLVSSIPGMISSFINEEKEIEVVLMTTNRNRAFDGDNVSNNDLSKLKFHYPSANKPYDTSVKNHFVSNYRRIYGARPNRYATRGFDLTMDILLRLASTNETLYEAADSTMETEYVENKFRYSKKSFGGFYNQAVYIIKYQDLKIVEVEK